MTRIVCAECGTEDGAHLLRCSSIKPETRRWFEDEARRNAEEQTRRKLIQDSLHRQADTERIQVHRALDQLEPHSPAWVQLIRAYVIKLERKP